jgi:hypothetical protein
LGEDGIYWSSPGVGAFIQTRLQRAGSHPSGAGTQKTELVVRPPTPAAATDLPRRGGSALVCSR